MLTMGSSRCYLNIGASLRDDTKMYPGGSLGCDIYLGKHWKALFEFAYLAPDTIYELSDYSVTWTSLGVRYFTNAFAVDFSLGPGIAIQLGIPVY